MKRLLVLLLVIVIMSGLLSACGGTPAESQTPSAKPSAAGADPASEAPSQKPLSEMTEEEILLAAEKTDYPGFPLVEDGSVSFTFWLPMVTSSAPYTPTVDTNYSWGMLQKRSGVDLVFIEDPESYASEKFNLMMTSGDFTDLFKYAPGTSNYVGGVDKAVDDGVYLALNQYVEQYAPNFMAQLEEDSVRRTVTTDSGTIYKFGYIGDVKQSSFAGPLVRKDWLDDLGLGIPETFDEWYDVLSAFRDNKTGGEGPFELHSSGFHYSSVVTGGFGVASNNSPNSNWFNLKNGKVVFSPLEQGFKDYITTMRKWYEDKLIDQDFVSNTNSLYADSARISNNKTGAYIGIFSQSANYWVNAVDADEGTYFALAPQMRVSKDIPRTIGQVRLSRAVEGGVVVTTKCSDPVIATKMFDYLYSEEGSVLGAYGIEGITYDIVDGKPLIRDLITHNPNGMTTGGARHCHLMYNVGLLFYRGVEDDKLDEEGRKYIEMWNGDSWTDVINQSDLTYTIEEGTEFSNIMGDVQTYIFEECVKFIVGLNSIEDGYDAFIAQLNSMQVARATEICQAAYTRFLNR